MLDRWWRTFLVFHAACNASADYSDEKGVRLSVRSSVRPSVKRVHCDKTEERSVQILHYKKDHLA